MAYSIIQVGTKPKTYAALTRLQAYIEKSARSRDDTPRSWKDTRHELQDSMTGPNYDKWIAPVQAREEEGRLILGAPTEFHRAWLEDRLSGLLGRSLDAAGHGHLQLAYEVATPARATDPNAPRIMMSRDDWAEYTRLHLAERGITPRQGQQSERYNSPLSINYTLTASPQWFKDHPEQKAAWIEHSAGFVRHLHGEAQVLGVVVHEHQATMHLHIAAIPIDQRGRLSASSFTRTKQQLEMLHTQYNRYLRDHGIMLERGQNARLERALAAAPPEMQRRALHADEIPLGEVLERLEADRDGRDPRRWTIGDRLIQVHDDGHGFSEFSGGGVDEGRGAIDLVVRLRQEGTTPMEEHDLAVDYLSQVHPERVTADRMAPPLLSPAPESRSRHPLERQSIAFGESSRWEPGQFLVVDGLPEALAIAGTAKGWGRIAIAEHPEALPVDEMDEALAKGWMVDVASRNDRVWHAVEERYGDEIEGRQVWRSPAPGKTKAAEKASDLEMAKGPDIGPEMMLG